MYLTKLINSAFGLISIYSNVNWFSLQRNCWCWYSSETNTNTHTLNTFFGCFEHQLEHQEVQIESQPTDTLTKSIINVLLLHQSRKIGQVDGYLFDFEKVVTFYQILSPLHKMNLIFERTDSSIGEVVPFIRDQRGSWAAGAYWRVCFVHRQPGS